MIKINNCPICKEEELIPHHGYDFKTNPEIYEFLELNSIKSNWSVCKECGFLFQNPRAKAEKISELYSSGLYRQDREYKESFFEARYNRPLTHLDWAVQHGFPDKKTTMLDIGAGYGGAVKSFMDRDNQVIGVELDENLCNAAVEHYGVALINSDIMNADLKDSSFDLIYSAHVHEHLDDFQLVNDRLFKLLKPGGMFLCILPTYRWSGTNGQGYVNVFHNSIFTKTSLYNMFVNCGLEPVNFKYPFNASMAEVWGLAKKRMDGEKANYPLRKDSSLFVKKEIVLAPYLFNVIYKLRSKLIHCYWVLKSKKSK